LNGSFVNGEFGGLGQSVSEGELEEMGGGFEGEEVCSGSEKERRKVSS